MSSTPIFHLLQLSTGTKGVISQCYQMLLTHHLRAHPIKSVSLWEGDLGPLTGDQWVEALQSSSTCSLNVAQKVSRLYIILGVHYTPKKLHKMGRLADPLCGRCRQHTGDVIHLLWQCPKLHRFWSAVLGTLTFKQMYLESECSVSVCVYM